MTKKIISLWIAATLLLSISAFAMPTGDFDAGMAKGIEYFNNGMYYEARDEFQWFCDANWGAMDSGQQQYALDYLGGAKQKIAVYECTTGYQKAISQTKNYFNQGLYYEAKDCIQRFCDSDGHWYNMTPEQQNEALWYINQSMQKINALGTNNAKSQNVFDFMVDYCKQHGTYNDGIYMASLDTIDIENNMALVLLEYEISNNKIYGTLDISSNVGFFATRIDFEAGLSKPYASQCGSIISDEYAFMYTEIYPSLVNVEGNYLPPITDTYNVSFIARSSMQKMLGTSIVTIVYALDHFLKPNGYSVADLGFTNF